MTKPRRPRFTQEDAERVITEHNATAPADKQYTLYAAYGHYTVKRLVEPGKSGAFVDIHGSKAGSPREAIMSVGLIPR